MASYLVYSTVASVITIRWMAN